MSADIMKVANQRRNEYKQTIAKMEKEIVEYRELIEDLDNFIEFGQALVGEDAPASTQPDEVSKRVSRPVAAQPAQPASNAAAGDSKDDQKSIASVLASRAS